MGEWKLFSGNVARVSTFEFHKDRPRAPHLEEAAHRNRLIAARDYVNWLMRENPGITASDLGCGDGGLLSLLKDYDVWGYDFSPANTRGWVERGVKAEFLDVFNEDWEKVRFGVISILTEVLEHLTDPHGVLRKIPSKYIVASSPQFENDRWHSEEHAWAWDFEGYEELFKDSGWSILRHETVEWSQLLVAERV